MSEELRWRLVNISTGTVGDWADWSELTAGDLNAKYASDPNLRIEIEQRRAGRWVPRNHWAAVRASASPAT